MPEPQSLTNADGEGILKLILMMVGSGFGLKVTVALINKIWERLVKQDEYSHLSRDRFETVVWEKLRAEEALTDTLRKEYAAVREQLYEANTKQAVANLELDQVKEECSELRAENERFRQILEKLNREHNIRSRDVPLGADNDGPGMA